MPEALNDVVEVFITRESAAIETASFNIPAILATFTNFSERTRVYTGIAGVEDDFATTSNVWKMASKLFGQQLKPSQIVVGRRQVDTVNGSVATVSNSTAYTVTINGTVFSFTSDATATATEIVAGLKAAYDLAPVTGVTFTNNLDGTFVVAVTTPGTAWSITASANLTLANVAPTETYVDALTAVEIENDSWYALMAESHLEADILALAGAIEAREKRYFTSTQDVAVPTTSITDVATKLFDLNYDRTAIVYLPTADNDFPECAWVGYQLQEIPGSNDWDLKSVSGVTVSRLTPTQIVNLRAKSCNFFIRKVGIELFQDGNSSSGFPIDEGIFIDWLRANLQESVFFRMANVKKIPFTRAGATIIENDIRTVMSLGQSNGGIAPEPPYRVVAPDPLAILPAQRAQRIMGDFVVTFRLAGSVRKVVIRGTAQV